MQSLLILRFRLGQLGQGTEVRCNSVPMPVAGLASRKIRQVACGGYHTLLLDESGKLLAFGSGANGRLGLGNTTDIANPAEISALASVTVKSIACGWSSR
jgi:RCC1 and BTB domain-containing protein